MNLAKSGQLSDSSMMYYVILSCISSPYAIKSQSGAILLPSTVDCTSLSLYPTSVSVNVRVRLLTRSHL